jgi:putative redox protein
VKSKVVYTDGMAFEAHLDGHTFNVDADEQFGGQNLGPKPKGLLLTSLAGCTGMDVVAILKKMRVSPSRFEVSVDGDLADEHPKKFVDIRIEYAFEGEDLPVDKIKKAVSLSEERYCGISATLAGNVPMKSVVLINGEAV